MEDTNKIEEEVKTTEENVIKEEKDEEFIEVVGDSDEVINETEEEVK